MTAAATKVSTTVNHSGVRTIALDDPDRRNALSTELLDGLIDALEHARTDPDTRCVVLSSTHPKVFCAGGNLAAFGDDSDTSYWRVLAARDIMRLYRQNPTELARRNVLQTTYGSGEAVLHPPNTPVFNDAASLAAARRRGTLKAIAHGRYFAVDPALAAQARHLGRDPSLYATLRPEALAVLYYLADRVHSISRQKSPLLVAAAARDVSYEDALAVRHVAAPSGYSLYTTGFSFDVKRHYASHAQAQAFQAMLDRLQALDVIAWQREAGVIHITVSERAHGLTPLLSGAALGDAT